MRICRIAYEHVSLKYENNKNSPGIMRTTQFSSSHHRFLSGELSIGENLFIHDIKICTVG
jgi:hypothetical protein